MPLLDLRHAAVSPAERERLCRLFFDQVYAPAFPNAEHAERPETWLPLLAAPPVAPAPLLHLVLAVAREVPPDALQAADIQGGVLFEYFAASRCGLVTYICVAEAARRRGVARALLDHAVATIGALGGSPATPVFAETEDPSCLAGGADRDKAHRRMVTLDALGFQHVPIAYRQPPLSPKTGWAEDLLLLVHAPDGDRTLPRRTIAAFLAEFEASLAHHLAGRVPPPHDPFAPAGSEDPLHSRAFMDLLPHAARPPLGLASAQAIRFTFFRDPAHLHPALGATDEAGLGLRPITLEQVQALAHQPGREAMRAFLEPMRSFTTDITISEEGGRKLPIVSLCERRPGGEPLRMRVRLPARLVTDWEGEEVTALLGDGEEVCLQATLVDTLALFATNHLAYSMSFVFGALPEEQGVAVDTGRLLALLSLAGSAGAAEGSEAQRLLRGIRFELAGHAYALHELATVRLRALCLHRLVEPEARQALLDGWHRRDRANKQPPLPLPILPAESDDVFSAVLRPIVRLFPEGRRLAALTDVRIGLCTVRPADLRGATAEIVDLHRFAEARRAIEQARKHAAPLNDFTRQLAGLAQDVIDYHDQDRHEVNDSLHPAEIVGGYLHFVHRHTLVRIYSHSRSFNRMRLVVGGCPYFLLTTVCASFNEHLVAKANRQVAELRPRTARLRFALSLDGRHNEAEARRIDQRFAFFENFVADAVPDLFRYETESRLFNAIEQQRGIARQREEGRRTLEQLDSYWRDRAGQAREWIESLLAAAVFTLTLWQVFGVVWDAGKDRIEEWLETNYFFRLDQAVFPWLGLPMLMLTLGITLYFLVTWAPAAMRSRRSAGLPLVPRGLLVFAVLLPLALLAWKILAWSG